jgi:hypothetical protein
MSTLESVMEMALKLGAKMMSLKSVVQSGILRRPGIARENRGFTEGKPQGNPDI